MKPYRLKHKPSGLYYQPSNTSGNNLSKGGKIYTTNTNGLSGHRDAILLSVTSGSNVYKMTKDILPWEESGWKRKQMICKVPLSDFEKEDFN